MINCNNSMKLIKHAIEGITYPLISFNQIKLIKVTKSIKSKGKLQLTVAEISLRLIKTRLRHFSAIDLEEAFNKCSNAWEKLLESIFNRPGKL